MSPESRHLMCVSASVVFYHWVSECVYLTVFNLWLGDCRRPKKSHALLPYHNYIPSANSLIKFNIKRRIKPIKPKRNIKKQQQQKQASDKRNKNNYILEYWLHLLLLWIFLFFCLAADAATFIYYSVCLFCYCCCWCMTH